jgi:hypothetical protein
MEEEMKKLWIKGALPDGCFVSKPQMEDNKCLASFHAYDVDTILRYGLSAEVLEEVEDFRQWLRSIVKHGGPKVNGKLVYDPETAMRIWEAFNEKVSGDH